MSRNRVSQVLSLTLLSPGIQGRVLLGERDHLSTRELLGVAKEVSWKGQHDSVENM